MNRKIFMSIFCKLITVGKNFTLEMFTKNIYPYVAFIICKIFPLKKLE